MPSPLFDSLGKMQPTSVSGTSTRNPLQMVQQFIQFRNGFTGNAKEECMKLINSGKLSQEQINQAQNMANQLQSIMGAFRK